MTNTERAKETIMSETIEKLVLTRTIAASVERVYDAWTNPAQMKRWFCPGEMTVPVAEADLREGGQYRIQMRSPDGELHTTGGVYQEIVPNQRLVFTWQWEGAEVETTVTVELRRISDRQTELTVTHEGFETSEARDKHGPGWNGCLDKLEPALA
jgi:uncharacterized protein YndB with AHSA1/START domain